MSFPKCAIHFEEYSEVGISSNKTWRFLSKYSTDPKGKGSAVEERPPGRSHTAVGSPFFNF